MIYTPLRVCECFALRLRCRLEWIPLKNRKWCALGALIAAAYQLTHDFDAADQLGREALRPRYGPATVIHVNDVRGHAAVLALLDEVIAAG
jgi:hypothetical protein